MLHMTLRCKNNWGKFVLIEEFVECLDKPSNPLQAEEEHGCQVVSAPVSLSLVLMPNEMFLLLM